MRCSRATNAGFNRHCRRLTMKTLELTAFSLTVLAAQALAVSALFVA